MTTLASLCSIDTIFLNAPVFNRQQLFTMAARHWRHSHGLPADEIVRRLEQREQLGSTALGSGVAVPHAKMPGLQETLAVFIRAARPVPFNAPDDKPVTQFLLLVVPEQAGKDHLQRLAEAVRVLGVREFREAVRQAVSAIEVSQAIRHYSGVALSLC